MSGPFVCSGGNTHEPAEVPAGTPQRPRSAVELQCPVCGRTVRLGWRAAQRLARMRLPADPGVVVTKITQSQVTVRVARSDTPAPPALAGPVDISLMR